MKYQEQFDAVSGLVRSAVHSGDAQSRVVISLHKSFPQFNWIGIFRLEGQALVLGAYHGRNPERFARLPLDTGICGAAVQSQRTVVVPDVEADARYVACFDETSSEIVVPVIKQGAVWGELVVDSPRRNAFGPDEVEFLEAVAKLLPERA